MECLDDGQSGQIELNIEAVRERFHRFVRPSKVGLRLARDCWPRTERGMRSVLSPDVRPRYDRMFEQFRSWIQANPYELSRDYSVHPWDRGMSPAEIRTINENVRIANNEYHERLEAHYRELQEEAEIAESIDREFSREIDEAQDEVERAINEWGDNQ
jgi:hypothetical protein